MSLGVSHWQGIGGFSVDQGEALRHWRLGGLEIPDSALSDGNRLSVPSSDSTVRSSPFFSSTSETAATGVDRRVDAGLSFIATNGITGSSSSSVGAAHPLDCAVHVLDLRTSGYRGEVEANHRMQPRSSVVGVDSPPRAGPSEICRVQRPPSDLDSSALNPGGQEPLRTSTHGHLSATFSVPESFALETSSHAIESVVLANNRSVRGFLGEGPPAHEIASLAAEGIRCEGLRCREGRSEAVEGRVLYDEMLECDTIESRLRISASFYTRSTFLYRRVNTFLRLRADWDAETGRNLGLYIGLLRECFALAAD
jgi:hypothetical protein